jgi:hypothetical protein
MWDAKKEGILPSGTGLTSAAGNPIARAKTVAENRPPVPVDGIGVVSTLQEAVHSAREFLPPATTIPDMSAGSGGTTPAGSPAPAKNATAGV